MKTVAFHTLGCKVNTYESNAMLKIFNEAGYQEVDFKQVADVYVINTCTVTNTGDSKSRQMIRKAIRKNPKATICVVGCYSQTAPEEIEKIEGVGVVLGTQYRSDIVKYVDEHLETGEMVIKVDNVMNLRKFEDLNIDRFKNTRAFLKIQDGCNNFCSYCKIPFARGKSRSRKKYNIIKEIEKLVEEGFKEVILIGINLGAYGEDLDEGENFESLLKSILEINKLKRVRIGSVYPDKISDEFMDMFKNKKLMPHLHISLQSCDDDVLKRMRRKYGSSLIEDRLLKLKEKVEDMEYTADVIVGFPGETEEMFQKSYDLIEKIGFSGIHIFQYSDRENTLASSFTDKIDAKIKKERADRLEALKMKMAEKEREKYIGKHLNVLLEERENGYLYGYSENYLRVKVKDNEIKLNSIINVKINSLEKEMLIADE